MVNKRTAHFRIANEPGLKASSIDDNGRLKGFTCVGLRTITDRAPKQRREFGTCTSRPSSFVPIPDRLLQCDEIDASTASVLSELRKPYEQK
jgi:hypothetical protein